MVPHRSDLGARRPRGAQARPPREARGRANATHRALPRDLTVRDTASQRARPRSNFLSLRDGLHESLGLGFGEKNGEERAIVDSEFAHFASRAQYAVSLTQRAIMLIYQHR